MAKDPAFLFYYQDFLVGTTFMTLEEKGAYITLLCHLADKGSLTEEKILKIVPTSIWHSISCKFIKTGNGFTNERLTKEVSRRKDFCESRRKSRMSNIRHTHVGRMETETINENEDKDIIVDGVVKGKEKADSIKERIDKCKEVFADKDFIDSAQKAYPSVVLSKEEAKMEVWIKARPDKSNKKNWKRFVNTWLSQAEREGVKGGRIKQDTSGDRGKKLREITKVVDV